MIMIVTGGGMYGPWKHSVAFLLFLVHFLA
jgi:hypothetical protein